MKATVSETAIRLSFDADRAELAEVTLICCDYDEDPIMVIVRGYQVRAHLDAHEADGLTEAILARYQIGKELGHFECDAQGTPCLSAATAGPTSPRGGPPQVILRRVLTDLGLQSCYTKLPEPMTPTEFAQAFRALPTAIQAAHPLPAERDPEQVRQWLIGCREAFHAAATALVAEGFALVIVQGQIAQAALARDQAMTYRRMYPYIDHATGACRAA